MELPDFVSVKLYLLGCKGDDWPGRDARITGITEDPGNKIDFLQLRKQFLIIS